MRKFKRFIPWLIVLFFPSIGFIGVITSGNLKSLIEFLNFSATVGIPVGVLMGAIAAAAKRTIKLGIWILLGSVFGCFLVMFGLIGFIITLLFVRDALRGELFSIRSNTSGGGDVPGAAEGVGEVIMQFLFTVIAIFGGGMGALLYYARHRPRK